MTANSMNVDEILSASRVAGDMAERFGALPEEKVNAQQAAISLTLAQNYMVELAKHLQDGMDPYDAMIATAQGTLPIPESKSTLFNLMGLRKAP